jgi:hypothetical protein
LIALLCGDLDEAIMDNTDSSTSFAADAIRIEDQENFDVEYVKKELNNLIWMYGHPKLTLRRAEEIACEMLVKIRQPST